MEEKKTIAEHKGFGSKLGFILAAAGSAVGLGNIWRFPYLAAKYGGGFFLLVYIILAVTFGFALMITEFAIGRRTGKSVLGAYKAVHPKFGFMGWIAAVVPALILSYYCDIGGWVIKYMTMYVTGQGTATTLTTESGAGTTLTFFESFISGSFETTIFFLVFVLLTMGIIMLGVQKGIEKVSKILMPVLFVLIIGIGIYTLTLPGALDGVAYYILPSFEDMDAEMVFKTLAAASSQLFYSTSIAMGINITYGSYMRKKDSLEASVRHVEFFDTGVAFLAGLIIVPSVFVFSGGDKAALGKGPGLMFITLPQVFETMPMGHIIGAAFFVLVTLAALTSSIALMETVVAAVSDKFGLSRLKSCVVVTVGTILLGMLSVLGYSDWSEVTIFGMQFLDFFDFITNSVMMPILALLTCILIGYVVKTKFVEEEVMSGGEKFRVKGLYRVMIFVVCPVCMVIILLTPFLTEI
ncbi:MAG: sodium-dependent transporter [Ruminiclostridium sp.]|nr:sodium-dependent transporter [Ruminiclostridium sp.]